ncbi:MAG: hypothetical protein J3Q66DRAFT_329779 [Benniella sp.]|nr:MAG: hypothetical protein J3Q66DRAFT_329779 [Benniella sp.]
MSNKYQISVIHGAAKDHQISVQTDFGANGYLGVRDNPEVILASPNITQPSFAASRKDHQVYTCNLSWYPCPLSLPYLLSELDLELGPLVVLGVASVCDQLGNIFRAHIAQREISPAFVERSGPVISQCNGVSILGTELRQRSRSWDSNATVTVGRCDCSLVLVVGALQLLVVALGIAFWILWWQWSSKDSLRWSPAVWMALVVELIPFLLVGAMADDTGTSQFKHLELLCGVLDR